MSTVSVKSSWSMTTNIAQQGIFIEYRMNLVQDRQIRYMEVAISNGQNSKWVAGMYKTAQNYPEAHPPSPRPPPFTTQPPTPQMPKTSECLRSSLWQVNFAYVDKWGAKSDWQTCLLVYVRKYPLRFKCFEVKLSSSRCYGASWKLLVSPGAQKELKYWSSDWKYRLEWKYRSLLISG